MFLGLDRRFTLPTDAWPDPLITRRWELEVRREYEFRRRRMVEPGIRTSPEASLSDVNYLVSATLNVIRASQERLDDQLRTQILLNSFRYTPPDFKDYRKGPTRAELDQYRRRVAAVKRAATGLRIPVGEVESALNLFFERMDKVVSALEESAKSGERKSNKKGPKKQPPVEQTGPSPLVLEWMLNRTQTDRILHQIEQLESYARDRSRLHEPVDRFLALANTFLEQTHKVLTVAPDNTLGVEINADGKQRSIATLSSGERQLVIMLAHLSLNPRLSGSGVFIVDEPELSLHVGWQERFVDAIREANPNVQLIMATHSPSIILDKLESCRSLS
jgi:DNA repair exonuclease SbcCD ATPase subunit